MNSSYKKKYWCGAFWCPLWIKKILSRNFNEACRIHDENYDEQLLTRKEIDYKFFKDMIETSDKVHLAYLYYVAVRLLGWISYKGQK